MVDDVRYGRDISKKLIERTGINKDAIHIRHLNRRGIEVIVGNFKRKYIQMPYVTDYDERIEKELLGFIEDNK